MDNDFPLGLFLLIGAAILFLGGLFSPKHRFEYWGPLLLVIGAILLTGGWLIIFGLLLEFPIMAIAALLLVVAAIGGLFKK